MGLSAGFAPESFAASLFPHLAIFYRNGSIDQEVSDSFRILVGIEIGRLIPDCLKVDDGDVRKIPRGYLSPPPELEFFRRKGGHRPQGGAQQFFRLRRRKRLPGD